MTTAVIEPLDNAKVNTYVSEAINYLDAAMRCIDYAKSEIRNKYSGESFDAYIDVLDSMYSGINDSKNQAYDLFR